MPKLFAEASWGRLWAGHRQTERPARTTMAVAGQGQVLPEEVGLRLCCYPHSQITSPSTKLFLFLQMSWCYVRSDKVWVFSNQSSTDRKAGNHK